jgi:hypothetical protein
VSSTLGSRYVEAPPAAISDVYKDAGPVTPVIFVLSAGTDPTGELIRWGFSFFPFVFLNSKNLRNLKTSYIYIYIYRK